MLKVVRSGGGGATVLARLARLMVFLYVCAGPDLPLMLSSDSSSTPTSFTLALTMTQLRMPRPAGDHCTTSTNIWDWEA